MDLPWICHDLPSLYTIIYQYIPIYTNIYLYIPIYTYIYLYIPIYTYIYLYIPSKSFKIMKHLPELPGKIHHDIPERSESSHQSNSPCWIESKLPTVNLHNSIFTVYESILAQNAMQHLQQNSIPGAAWNGIPSDDKSLSKGPRDLVWPTFLVDDVSRKPEQVRTRQVFLAVFVYHMAPHL